MKQPAMKHFAIIGDDNSVSFGRSNVKEEDTPENYYEISKDQYDRFVAEPDKLRGYTWQDNKIVYVQPPPDPEPTRDPPPDQSARLDKLEQTILRLENRLAAVERRKEKTRGA
jgi:hypothetical protein